MDPVGITSSIYWGLRKQISCILRGATLHVRDAQCNELIWVEAQHVSLASNSFKNAISTGATGNAELGSCSKQRQLMTNLWRKRNQNCTRCSECSRSTIISTCHSFGHTLPTTTVLRTGAAGFHRVQWIGKSRWPTLQWGCEHGWLGAIGKVSAVLEWSLSRDSDMWFPYRIVTCHMLSLNGCIWQVFIFIWLRILKLYMARVNVSNRL